MNLWEFFSNGFSLTAGYFVKSTYVGRRTYISSPFETETQTSVCRVVMTSPSWGKSFFLPRKRQIKLKTAKLLSRISSNFDKVFQLKTNWTKVIFQSLAPARIVITNWTRHFPCYDSFFFQVPGNIKCKGADKFIIIRNLLLQTF